MGYTGQQRFEDIVLLLPDEEYEYGSRELGMRQRVRVQWETSLGGPKL
jgi:hypothetical protein